MEPFDIFALEEMMEREGEDFFDDPHEMSEDYVDQLVKIFVASPEAQYLVEKGIFEESSFIGGWAKSLIGYGISHLQCALTQLDQDNIAELLEDIFPSKIMVLNLEESEEVIPELIAFWLFLKREFSLEYAEDILEYLHTLEENYSDIMNDPERFGTGKGFMMAAVRDGVDLYDKEQLMQYISRYNRQGAENSGDEPAAPYFGGFYGGKDDDDDGDADAEPLRKPKIGAAAKKKKRKQAKASRRANRKK